MAQESQNRKPFHFKGMTTFIVSLSFILLTLSGIVLYASPRGRVANWTGWSVLGLEKEEWSVVHMAMALLFVIAGLVHLYYNWTVFWSYFKMRFEKGFNLKREFVAAWLVFAVFLGGTMWDVPPFAYLSAWNDQLKDHWEEVSTEPPVAHAEEWTVVDAADALGMSADAVIARFRAKGYVASGPEQTLQSIASENGVSPNALFALLQTAAGREGEATGTGSGLGRKTLAEFCSERGVDLEDALETLEEAGIPAGAEQRFRTIADAAGLTPGELVAIIER